MGWTFPYQLLPSSALSGAAGLQIGGIPLSALAAEHGTPVVVYDEEHLRRRCAEVMQAFPDGASYAGKALLCRAMARLVHEEGLGIDVASSGELAIAMAGGVPASALTLHGNNKSSAELEAAIAAGVGRIVIDSWDECDRVAALADEHGSTCVVALRINPGVAAATHQSVMTGHAASKFGVAIAGGDAAALVARIQATAHLELTGIHVHAGSQITDLEPLGEAIAAAAAVARDCGAADLIVGGGIGVAYTTGQRSVDIADWGAVAHRAARASGFEGRILAEPGRTIAATAAATVYTIGTIKRLVEGTILLAIDGGISDNPRAALYGSMYQPILVDHPSIAEPAMAGPYTVREELRVERYVRSRHRAAGSATCWGLALPPRDRRIHVLDGVQLQRPLPSGCGHGHPGPRSSHRATREHRRSHAMRRRRTREPSRASPAPILRAARGARIITTETYQRPVTSLDASG